MLLCSIELTIVRCMQKILHTPFHLKDEVSLPQNHYEEVQGTFLKELELCNVEQ